MLRRSFIAKIVAFAATVTVASALTGCGEKKADEIKVGATAGPHSAIVNEAAKVAKNEGLNVKVVEFTDYVTPNRSLAEGALDVAVYQHEPFLNNYNAQNGTDLKNIAPAVVQPMGFYSNKVKSLDAVPVGAKVSIPNDPTNSGRALLLLQTSGLIKLKAGVTGNTATVRDIVDNPRKIHVVELEAAQLPRSIDDVDFTCVPMNYVISAGLSPKDQGFYFESRQAPYALMIIASRANNAQDPNVRKFVKAYQSEQVRAFIEKTFNGAVQPAW